MIDCGATSRAFIDSSYAQFYDLVFIPLPCPRTITVVDGRTTSSGTITHIVRVPFTVGHYTETQELFVTKLGHYPIILGMLWLRSHNPMI